MEEGGLAEDEKTNSRPKVIISAEKVVIEVGAYDELPGKVVNVPGTSGYWSCLADELPAGEPEHGGDYDKRVNISNKEGGRLAEDVKNRETNSEKRKEDKHNAKEEEPKTAESGTWNWRKIPTQRRFICSRRN